MSFRTTLILAVVLIGLGFYAYFGEYKGAEKKEKNEEQAKTLLEVKKEDVAEIGIEGSAKPVHIVSVSAEAWQITQPLKTRADDATVGRILGDFEKLKYKDVVEQQPKDLSSYDLKNPKVIVHLKMKKGQPDKTIYIGAKNPVNDVYYVRVNQDPRVYAVESSIGDIATTTLFDLRDKKLTDFSSEKVNTVDLKTKDQELQFQKDSGVWKMKKPAESPASENQIASLLSSLESLRASEFVDDAQPDPAKYGLQTPSAEVQLVLDKGLQQKILFGNKDNGQIYCEVEGNPGVAKVSDSFSDIFNKKGDEWREKKLLIFNRFDAEQIRVKSGNQQYAFTKNKEEKWSEQSPQKGDVDTDKIQEVLEKLENAEISKYGDKTSLTVPPSLEISLTMRDWQEKITNKHLAFGPAEGTDQSVKNDDYNTIVFTGGTLQQDIEKALQEIKPKPPAPAAKKK
jgi:Domain of unknown function (DUF4340)